MRGGDLQSYTLHRGVRFTMSRAFFLNSLPRHYNPAQCIRFSVAGVEGGTDADVAGDPEALCGGRVGPLLREVPDPVTGWGETRIPGIS